MKTNYYDYTIYSQQVKNIFITRIKKCKNVTIIIPTHTPYNQLLFHHQLFSNSFSFKPLKSIFVIHNRLVQSFCLLCCELYAFYPPSFLMARLCKQSHVVPPIPFTASTFWN